MRKLLLLLLLSSTLFATEYEPWFGAPWEFHSRLSYTYSHTERVQSPAGSFKYIDNYHEFAGSLMMTVWPDLSVEAELAFLTSDDIDFSYEVFILTARKLWLDDLCGDWISLATGVTMAFPPKRILHDFDFPYHGHVNAELHLTAGKEFRSCCTMEWNWRLWGLIGYGVAEKGSPWVHGLITFDQGISECAHFSLFMELLYGLGGENIIPGVPFRGYASIQHETIDLGGRYQRELGLLGSLSFLGFINVHARNFTEHSFGVQAALTIPFGL